MIVAQNHLYLLKALKNLNQEELLHVNGKLISHLQNTYGYLQSWGNREALCIAGLYHAVYSTDGYAKQLIDVSHRSHIIDLIGIEAEKIIYYYAACDRNYFYARIGNKNLFYRNRFTSQKNCLEFQLFCDLLELTFANELEIAIDNKNFKEKHRDWYTELFNRSQPYVSSKAFQAYQNVFFN